MRERAYSLLNSQELNTPPLLCTFHKFGFIIFKVLYKELDRKNNFIIIDTDDKRRVLKSINKDIPSALLGSEISKYKNSIMTPH